MKDEFLEAYSTIQRDGADKLLEWLEKSDFFKAPASTRFHLSEEGGLCEHSLNVFREFKKLLGLYPGIECSPESAAIMGLLHDVCKVSYYAKEQRNRKVDGEWEAYDYFAVNEKFAYGAHGSKSVYIIQSYIKLLPVEAVGIANHMGAWENKDCGNAFAQYPLAWLLSVADQSATYTIEGKS
jgi:hypothetical protein